MNKKIAVLMLLILCTSMFFLSCGKKDTNQEVDTPKVEETEPETEPETEEVDNHEGQVRSYLTGQWISEKLAQNRPLAIMMGNTSEASPQSGIGSAGVVYEVPVEGSITRLMPIIQNYTSLEKIGSVRSCRFYFVYYALEFDAVYAHFGQSKYAKSLLAQDNVNNINGLSGIGNQVYFRSSDAKAPHNAFANGKEVRKAAKSLNYRIKHESDYQGHYLFADEESPTLNENGETAVYVAPGYRIDQPWFEYNEKDGLYYRFQYGKAHTDALTGKQLTCKNIILQYSKIGYMDDNLSLNIDTQSGGEGMYVTNGKAISITWSKESTYGVTHYYDSQNQEIKLNPGKTWVLIIDKDHLDKVKISASME